VNGTPQITDFVGLFIFLASLVFPEEAAAIFGPYMAIVAASTLGASFATIRRVKTTRTAAIVFFVRATGLALIVSVPLAQELSRYYPTLPVRAGVTIVAFLVGIIGDDWPKILRFAAFFIRQKVKQGLDLPKDKEP
jgi:hypothetical protein